ncbi:MAG: ribulokinase [Nitrospina sp.]|jgi:L-ribulokinase|nr:ribulokinase [Nitrospina sp.]
MKQRKYALGLDFGTKSVRCLAVDIVSGEEKTATVSNYSDGVITRNLPGTSVTLGSDWALQNPADWLSGLREVIPRLLQKGEITAEEIVGLGISFTSCTVMPTTEDGAPLCSLDDWENEPHAWPKLWKHHAAQPEADLINGLAQREKEPWLKRYGGLISSEWLLPKALQIFKESPKCFAASQRFIEAGDWVVWKLCGKEMRSMCQAGYKALWDVEKGYPSHSFLEKLSNGFGHLRNKLGEAVYPVGTCAGGLTPEMASQLKLLPGISVSTAIIDAHAALAGSGVADPGKMVMVMGTSTCHMVVSKKEVFVEGVAGVVKDGIIPGYYGYESGQSAVGDIFAWVTKYGIPETYYNESQKSGASIHELLAKKAARQEVGSHGLLALDWLNGNRSILMNSDLSGLLIGLTLNTRPEDIYRAMIEATAFGTKTIIKTYENNGITINDLYACGGLANNELLLQIYSDILGLEVKVATSSQTTALGAAILGAVSAGSKRGGYDSYPEAIKKMVKPAHKLYKPELKNQRVYSEMFKNYVLLHDYFGKENPSMMKNLKYLAP